MRRALTATLVTCGLALVVAACGGGSGSKATSTRGRGGNGRGGDGSGQRPGAEDLPLGRVVGPRARRLQEGRRRLRHGTSGGHDRPRRRHRRRQDHGRAAQRRRARRRLVLHLVERRRVLLERRLDRPRADDEAGRHRGVDLPGLRPVLHAVQRRALRAPDPGRRLRLLLQQGPAREGRRHRAAEDGHRADRPREEAHHAQGRRLAGRGRVRPVLRVLPEHARRLRDAVRRAVAGRGRQLDARRRTRPGRRC